MLEVEVWVVVDESGDYEVGKEQDQAQERYDDEIGSSGPRRYVRVVLSVPTPAPVTLKGTVPAEGEALLTV